VLPTVALAVLLLLHVPPAALQTRVDGAPRQTEVVPVMLAGVAFTVTTVVAPAEHPV
jgi:hypothetical protein